MTEIEYRTFVWLAYRLTGFFAIGTPLVIFICGIIRKEGVVIRLMSIYWKNASLLAITMLLFTGESRYGYITSLISPFLMVGSVWFWIDINEELADFPINRALPLTVKIWRWCISFWAMIYIPLAFQSIQCFSSNKTLSCLSWLEPPKSLHEITKVVLKFLFGASWNETVAEFLGYLTLIFFIAGLVQWMLVGLPKQGRIAGGY